MGKIATKAFCNSLQSGSFSGDTTQCPTKSEIEGAGFIIKGSYASNQLVQEEDVYYLFWEYTFSVSPSGNTTMNEMGDTQVYSVTSYKVQYQSSSTGIREEVDRQDVGYSSSHSGPGSWNNGNNTLTIGSNDTPNSRNGSITFTQNESSKRQQVTYSQAAGEINWGTITITSFTVDDIPASGGSITEGEVSYTQNYGYGSVNTGYTSTSGASVSFGTAVSAGSRGTTTGTRRSVGTLTVTVSRGGYSDNDSATVYQQENTRWATGTDWGSWGSWSVSVNCNPSSLGKDGGTVRISATATRSRSGTINYSYTSGATSESPTSDSDSATPSLSYNVTSGSSSGVSLSGTTLSVGSVTSDRTIRVTGTYGGDSDYCTINQTGVEVTYSYFLDVSPTSDTHSAAGDTTRISINAYGREYWDGSIHDTFDCGWSISTSGDTSYFDVSRTSGTGSGSITVSSDKISSTSDHDITLTISNTSGGSSKRVTITQEGVSWSYTFTVSPSSLTWGANETSAKSISITSTRSGSNGDSGSVSWSASESISWGSLSSSSGSGSGSTSFSLSSTNSGGSRSGTITFTQGSSGIRRTVTITQQASSVTAYQYKFSADPSSLSFPASGGNRSTSVTSERRQLTITGGSSISPGSWTSWSDWSGSVSGTGFSKVSGGTVKASSNSSTSTRSGTFKLTQNQPNKYTGSNSTYKSDSTPINVRLSQSGIQYTSYTLSVTENTYDGGPMDISLTVNGSSRSLSWGGSTTVHERDRISLSFSMYNSSDHNDMDYIVYLNNSSWRTGSLSPGEKTTWSYTDNSVQSDLIFRVEQK